MNFKNQPSQSMHDIDVSAEPASPQVIGTFTPLTSPIVVTETNYLISLRLLAAGFTLKKARMTNANGDWGAIFDMPAVQQNCTSDCNTCFANGNYTPILNVQCNDRFFKLQLRLQKNSDANVWGSAVFEITPDCNYTGEVLCLG